ncbi:helix-turn-helix domain-containing protein [Lentzea sp. NPDC051213]|uniref:nSTAND1 domain-containing NTPase n=1 Tax=Lentzea sp. NPDC051213 TaxID=3364126 RepID=UPI0037B9031F
MPRKERPLDSGDTAVLTFARELRSLREKAGRPTYRELSSLTHYSEAALSQAAGGRKLPTLQVTLAYVRACGGSEEEWERRWYATSAAEEPEQEPETGSPYTGLAAFQPEDADRFFGRDRLVGDLAERVSQHRVVVVVGASGAGKSSLLRAGLMPRLGNRAVLFTPGPRPLDECARVIANAKSDTVFVVDQFEEIFTLCEDRDVRRRFVDLLTGRKVVLGVRADFYGHCTDFPALVEAMGDAQVTVGPMSTDELRAAIIQPARRTGHAVETALVAELVANCAEQAGALPLLSHALLETWHRRKGNTLTLQGFRAAGGFEGALTRTAESVFARFTERQQELVRSLFIRLTAVGDGTEDTKRRICRNELDDDPDAVLVLEALTTHRLVTVDQERVEITHEALIRCWPRLREWLAADRDGLRAHRDLAESAAVWESLDRDPGALIRGARLASFRDWRPPNPLTVRESEFLTASLTMESAELAATRKDRRRLRVGVALLSVLLVATTAVGITALQASSEATRQRNTALSQKVAQDVQRLRGADPALAAQLALAAYRLSPTPEARSQLLSSFTPFYATRLTGHRGHVNAVAYSSARQLIASASHDRTVRLIDIADPHHPRELSTLTAHTESVVHVAFNSDGTVLATAGWDRTARLWDTTTGNVLATLTHADLVNAVAFDRNSKLLATAGKDRTVRLWDLTDMREVAVLPHSDAVVSLAFNPAADQLVTGSWDGTARLWDLNGNARPLPGHTGAVQAVAFSPDGQTVATAGQDRVVRLSPVGGGEPRVLSGHTDAVRGLAFSADGRLASTGVDRTVRVWDLAKPADPLVLTGHTAPVVAATFAGGALATASDDHTVRLWDLPGGLLQAHSDSVYAVATSGKLVATGSYDREVRLWQDGRLLTVLTGPGDAVNSVAFSPDGKVLLAASADHRVHRWDIIDPATPRPLPALAGHTDAVNAMAVSPDGTTIATGSTDRAIILWDAKTGASLGTLSGHADSVQTLAFSPDGRRLASGSGDFSARIWDVGSRQVVTHLTGHTHAIKSVAFSPDGKLLATGSTDYVVRVWDLTTGTRTTELTGHTDTVHAVAFSPDSRTLASASADQEVRLWRLADHTPLATLAGHGERVYALAFSSDGRTLLSAGGDRTVRVWEADAEHAAERVCSTAFPALSEQDWNRYFPDVGRVPICPA